MDTQGPNPGKLSVIFDHFGEKEAYGTAPLYTFLAQKIKYDKEILAIAAHARERQPIPNLFFGAVHFLLLKEPGAELAKYYPSLHLNPAFPLPYELFQSFCLEKKEAIISILRERIVQTNVVNRCAYLMPVLHYLYGKDSAIQLVELGASAGLLLNMDHYTYSYNRERHFGKSSVKIATELRAGKLPSFHSPLTINRRIGIDQHPIDLKKNENDLWLKALIWPGMQARFDRMHHAIDVMKRHPIEWHTEKNIEGFRDILLSLDRETSLFLYHCHVLYQFMPEERKAFWKMLDALGKVRDLHYLAAEAGPVLQFNNKRKGTFVELISYHKGKKTVQRIAETDGHANWLKWLV